MTKIRTHIAELPKEQGKQVTIAGHAQIVRAQSSVVFIILRDITGTIQCVVGRGSPMFDLAKEITTESVLEITGAISETKITAGTPNGIEVQVADIKILSVAEPLPIPVVEKGDAEVTSEKRQDWRFLTLRRERDATIIKALSALDTGYRAALLDSGFIEVHTPKLMPTPSESNSELFELKDYFGRPAFLAQSPQLYKQMSIASGLERTFEIGPVFRANPSFTTRHDTEFTSYDGEMGYISDFGEVMDTLEKIVAYVLTSIRKTCGRDIKRHFGVSDFQLKKPIPRITMAAAKEILRIRAQASEDADLSPAEERAICEYIKEKTDSDFVFITEFPWSARPFYHKKGVSSDDGATPISVSADLLYKGVEITTTAQREENYETLCAQCADKGIRQEGMQWYLDCFRYGMPPHGGWGFGGTRFIKQLLDLSSVRDATFLYRGPNRLAP